MKKVICTLFILFLSIGLLGCLERVDHPIVNGMSESEFREFVEPLKNTTVAIVSKVFDYELSLGSGSIFLKEPSINDDLYFYYVVTNYHVVEGGVSYEIHTNYDTIEYATTYSIPSNTINYSANNQDLAILRFESEFDYPLLQIIPYDDREVYVQVDVGQDVFGIGTPFSLENFNSVSSMGIVKNVNDYWVTHSANINPGNSGGPLFTSDGTFIGINTQRIEVIDGVEYTHIIESMHVNYVADLIYDRLNNAQLTIGINIQNHEDFLDNDAIFTNFNPSDYIDVNTEGVVVIGVSPTKPADGKLELYDQIISVNGVNIRTSSELSTVLGTISLGNSYTFKVSRKVDSTYQIIDVVVDVTHI